MAGTLAAPGAASAQTAAAPPATTPAATSTSALEAAGVREVIVKRVAGLGVRGRVRVRDSVDAVLVRRLPLADTEVLRVPAGGLEEALAELADSPDVVYAEANAPVRAFSDDPLWRLQWALENRGQSVIGRVGTPDADMDGSEALSIATGAGVLVGIVDSGVDAGHPELSGRLTGNPGERGGGRESNRVDDDGNGYVDDFRGWDFVPDANDADATPGPDSTPEDPDGHGTHVAGIVAAERDNREGISGAAPGAHIVALRALGENGSGTLADVARAFVYAGELGLPVVNASLGAASESLTLRSAIQRHPNTLFVAAAGNGGSDGVGDDVDSRAEYPCATAAANVLCVGASDSDDRLATFSNYGSSTVDLYAPGVDVISTYAAKPFSPYDGCSGDAYCALSGTSMAAPHAAAAAALVASVRPDLRGAALREVLIDSAEVKSSLGAPGRRRLNAARALDAVADADADAVDNRSDNCPAVANGGQPDADADGIGDACDTTPAPSPTPEPTPAPAPAPESAGIAREPLRLTARLSERALERRGWVVASVRTNLPAAVTLQIARSGSRRVLVRVAGGVAQEARLLVRRRLEGRRLSRGRHVVTLTARSGADTATAKLPLVVR